ncbi:MAG: hypothetical protein M1822_007633 [Bathelium mastoideum]|nr:MAG: hypothetical protein M1822_007633 [Bathelium mastoideum]
MSRPCIVFVPGFWEGPAVFDGIRATLLKAYGYSTTTIARLSTGFASPNNPTQEDDITVIRTALEVLVHRGNTIVLVVHSAGGFIGMSAVPGLTVSERKSAGLLGGIAKIVAITAALVREDKFDQFPPFFDPRGERLFCKDPANYFFNGWSSEAARPWIESLQPEPEFDSWLCPLKYGPELFDKLPSIYLVCKEDKVVPTELQRMCAEVAKSEIRECEAGHMVMLTHPEVVVDLIRETVENLA